MRHQLSRRLAGFRAILCAAAALAIPAAADDLIWNFGSAAPGSAATSSTVANLTVSELTRGNNNDGTTTNPLLQSSAVSSTYSGASGSYNAGAAARTGALNTATSAYFEVTLTPADTYTLTVSGVSFGSRSTGTGPQALTVRSSADGYAADLATATQAATSTWTLQNLAVAAVSTTPLTLRIYGSAGAGNASAGTNNWRIDDLKISVVVSQGGVPAPAITGVNPASGNIGTAVTITGTNFGNEPVVRFNGTTASGAVVNPEGTSISVAVPTGTTTGPVSVQAPGGVAAGPVFTIIAQPTLTLTISPDPVAENASNPAATGTVTVTDAPAANVSISLVSSLPASVTVPAYVTLAAGQTSATFNISVVPDPASYNSVTATVTASAAGYDPASDTLTVNNTDAQPTTVVINKYSNGSPDTIELLVTGNGTAGTTVDMRGMLVKDFSSSMNSDGGGVYEFKAVDLFSAVKVGTLIVITNDNTANDVDGADFVIRVGLTNGTYFTSRGGSFDISTTEMVMIKAAGSPTAGVTGSLHALAGGAAGSQFTAAPPKKLLASAGGSGVTANNATSTLADYDGTGATGGVTLTAAAFGVPNNSANNAYIRILRGETSVDGLGSGAIVNGNGASVLAGRNIFLRGIADQTVILTLSNNGGTGASALTSARVSVPAAFGTPTAAGVTLSGAGGASVASVNGQDVTITGMVLTSVDPLQITFAGLTAPNPSGAADDGVYPFAVQTAGEGGALKDISAQPAAVVTVPVVSLRDVNANGVPLDLNKKVAIEAVCTEEDFDSAVRTSAYVQDGDFGINIFFPGAELNLVAGNRYIITGTLIQFSGLTEIQPSAAADVINFGAGTPPAPLVVTVPDLLANAEAYEGRLIRINGLSRVSGTWGTSATVAARDAAGTAIDIRIQSGSEAVTSPSFPINITGIFGQFDGTAPFTAGYQIMPRKDADVESLGIGAYYDWASLYNAGGPQEDSDGDGVPNMVEYATGTLPNDAYSLRPPVYDHAAGTFTVNKGEPGASDTALQYIIEASTDLTNWNTNNLDPAENSATRLSVIYSGTAPRVYFRLKLVRP